MQQFKQVLAVFNSSVNFPVDIKIPRKIQSTNYNTEF